MTTRQSRIERETNETKITVQLDLDGSGEARVSTGVPFFDHMCEAFTSHGGFDVNLSAEGDLEVDPHHVIEDAGLSLGEAFRDSLGEKRGIVRFSSVLLPMDEALMQTAVDISGRPFLGYHGVPISGTAGGLKATLFKHFFQAFVNKAAITLHVELRYGEDLHHIFEALFKATGRTLSQAAEIHEESGRNEVPSTKGSLS